MKKNILVLTLTLGLFITLLIASCAKHVGKLPVTTTTTTTGTPGSVSPCDTITYTKHIKPLFDNYCISCHGTPPNTGAPIFTTYAAVKADAAKIKTYAVDGVPEIMPQGGPPLAQAQKDLITCWVNNGMKE